MINFFESDLDSEKLSSKKFFLKFYKNKFKTNLKTKKREWLLLSVLAVLVIFYLKINGPGWVEKYGASNEISAAPSLISKTSKTSKTSEISEDSEISRDSSSVFTSIYFWSVFFINLPRCLPVGVSLNNLEEIHPGKLKLEGNFENYLALMNWNEVILDKACDTRGEVIFDWIKSNQFLLTMKLKNNFLDKPDAGGEIISPIFFMRQMIQMAKISGLKISEISNLDRTSSENTIGLNLVGTYGEWSNFLGRLNQNKIMAKDLKLISFSFIKKNKKLWIKTSWQF